MDVFRFINSKDIRKYLKEIDYKFSPLETAWLIYQCESATLEEKHKAWQEIIDTMPDCSIEWHSWRAPRESLHQFLKDYMALEIKGKKLFYSHDDGAIFHYSITIDGCDYYKDAVICSTFGDCILQIKKDLNEITEGDETVDNIIITKRHIDNRYCNSEMVLREDFQILSINPIIKNDKDDELYNLTFPRLWFAFPTPFKKGDIVWSRYNGQWLGKEPFVLKEIATDVLNRRISEGKHNCFCDSSDMIAYGYFQYDDGTIFGECIHNYMNLEYYPYPFKDKRRALMALSNFQKGKIDISLFANAYHHILTQEYAGDCKPTNFTDEGLALAGIK